MITKSASQYETKNNKSGKDICFDVGQREKVKIQ